MRFKVLSCAKVHASQRQLFTIFLPRRWSRCLVCHCSRFTRKRRRNPVPKSFYTSCVALWEGSCLAGKHFTTDCAMVRSGVLHVCQYTTVIGARARAHAQPKIWHPSLALSSRIWLCSLPLLLLPSAIAGPPHSPSPRPRRQLGEHQ